MDDLFIEKTRHSPGIKFEKESQILSIIGNSLLEDPIAFYAPVFKWLDDYETDPLSLLKFVFKFNIIITSSNKMIFELMIRIKDMVAKDLNIEIEWQYPEDDEDLEELGELFKETINVPFQLVSYGE
ncbi:DUF1987 domain-containing protein [Sphingobacteriaceae bacterium AH-315-L07]|nr:DUF1987 domain-containing protein [Bacteroidia bacterium]MBN4052387.1 DUF1987 domain-containing protein [Sphingobacteriaceae bacterium AH-315-L07]